MADAALGALFGELLKAVIQAGKETANFKSILHRLSATLSKVKPFVDEIERSNKRLDRPTAETKTLVDLLTSGKVLVDKCLTIKEWSLIERYTHSKKLKKHYDSLSSFFQINVQAMLAMDVKKILVEIGELGRGSSSGSSSGFRGSCGVPQLPENIVGLDMQLEELKDMMMLNDKVVLAGISAPPGYGKTTLARMLCHDEEIKGTFGDNIFYVTVSKPANFHVIVQKLFLHKDRPQPLILSDEDAVTQLEHFLLQQGPEPILLVLDDVWPSWEPHIRNLKFRNIPIYKVLVTSRSEFPILDSTYKLKTLSYEDATTIFCHSAFPGGKPNMPDDLVKMVVKFCKLCPLALTVVGPSLYGKPEVMWRAMVDNWSEGKSIFSEELLSRLKTSIDALDEPILKQLFLDLGSFPEDQEIPANLLMDLWAELYNLDEMGMHTMHSLHKLSLRNLVYLVSRRKDDIEFGCYCNEHYVMQHDLLRDLAIHLTNQEPLEQRKRLIIDHPNSKLYQQPIHARLLSISTDETICSIGRPNELPEVEAVILNFRSENYSLPQFMQKMDRLKVLIVTNYGYTLSRIDNLPLLGYLSSLRRIRLEHVSISSLGTCSKPMKHLRKISLFMCKIGDTLDKCTTKVVMFPSLVEIEIDYCDDLVQFPAGLCKDNSTLEKISITKCNELRSFPDEFGRLTNVEILRLHSCIMLEELPESIGNLHKLSILDISDCVGLSKMPDRMRELCSLRKLHMRGCVGIRKLPPSVEELRGLQYVICDEEIYHIWISYEELAHVNIKVVRAVINLNWLHNHGP
ncbi:hypothetical protein LguiA_006158 [Lonicera macranthoides]